MAIGRFVTDLDRGDVMGPVDYTMSRFVVREYCHAVEMHQACFQGIDGQIAPPTLVHLDKLRLYKHACPAGTGPTARVHIEYDATIHAAVPVGVPLRVKGTVTERYVKRGRRIRDHAHRPADRRGRPPADHYRGHGDPRLQGQATTGADSMSRQRFAAGTQFRLPPRR